MRFKRTTIHERAFLLTFGIGVAAAAHAGFQYSSQDLIIGFRQASGIPQLVVNAGPVTNLYAVSAGGTLVISNMPAYTRLTNEIFAGDLNGVSWSAAAHVNNPGGAFPLDTLWVCKPRITLSSQTVPWQRASSYSQANPGSKIEGIGNSAAAWANANPSAVGNTNASLVMPDDGATTSYLYSHFMLNGVGAANYVNSFQGVVEATTPLDFSTAGLPVREDLYELQPGSGSASYLGYFEFTPDGKLTFTAASSTPVITAPTITQITRTNGTTTLSFTTVNGGLYTLHHTDAAGLSSSPASWPVTGSAVTGDGSVKSLSDSSTDDARFYRISAQ